MGRPKKDKAYRYRYVGRHTKLTEECVSKLEHAFSIGANVTIACYMASISRETYYKWIKENPDLSDRFDNVRQKLPQLALQNIANGIEKLKDIPLSERYLARKLPNEHADILRVENIGDANSVSDEDREVIKEYHEKLKANILKRSKEKAIKDGELKEDADF